MSEILTVTELTNAIKLCLEQTFPLVQIQGEISNCKLQSSGHLYFCLKDSQAQISAVMFRAALASLRTLPKDGDQVIVSAELNVYPPTGKYQIIVQELRQVGLGALLLKLEELKVKLLKRGWFKKEFKKPLPKFPRSIGVVTSPTGAVIQDILHILTRRFRGFHLILNPVKVQGEGAAAEIAQAIRQFNEHKLVDVIIVGRGGGSIEDLWAFNEEIVAEAIFNSTIPIIAAVGHETDHCIAEYVADVRAPTPSAAAELVMAEQNQHLQFLEQTRKRLLNTVGHLIRHDRQRLKNLVKQPLFQSPYALLGPWIQRTDDYRDTLDHVFEMLLSRKKTALEICRRQIQALNPLQRTTYFKYRFAQLQKSVRNRQTLNLNRLRYDLEQKRNAIDQWIKQQLALHKKQFAPSIFFKRIDSLWDSLQSQRGNHLKQLDDMLHAYNPKNLLAKGYTILFSEKTGSVITSSNQVEIHENVRLLLADGELVATIKDIHST